MADRKFWAIGRVSGWKRGPFNTLTRARAEALRLAEEKQELVDVEIHTITVTVIKEGVFGPKPK